jgi:hypothetical protein
LVAKYNNGSKITQPIKRCHIGAGERRGKTSIELLMANYLEVMTGFDLLLVELSWSIGTNSRDCIGDSGVCRFWSKVLIQQPWAMRTSVRPLKLRCAD